MLVVRCQPFLQEATTSRPCGNQVVITFVAYPLGEVVGEIEGCWCSGGVFVVDEGDAVLALACDIARLDDICAEKVL